MKSKNEEVRHLYIPQRLAVKSMRDSGYKNTAYALAELIDNSYQAIEAIQELNEIYVGRIEVLVVEDWEDVGQRFRQRPKQIAVLDNGCGMNSSELRRALQFGNGGHLNDREGIGRFGMGLPNSTVSQCRRADVWTWQAGHVNAIHSYLDLDEIEEAQLEEVPQPEARQIPEQWLQIAPTIHESETGTLVVWSSLDKVKWRTAKSTLENTEALVGRIYRKLLGNGLQLHLTSAADGETDSRRVRPNDPLYLMTGTSTPAPYDDKSMFQTYGKDGRQTFTIEFDGATHEVLVNLAYARPESRNLPDGTDAGHQPYGKHARSNVGVSVVRADRELSLDTAWSNRDLRERWWGAEVCFPPALDEVFGVTNNKQYATHFTEMADYYLDTQNDDEWTEIKGQWEEEDDPQRHLLEICNYLHSQIGVMRIHLREQVKGRRGNKQQRHDVEVESKATQAFKERAESGNDAGDADLDVPAESKRSAIEANLIAKKYTETSAREIADLVVSKDLRVVFVEKENVEAPAFFAIEVEPGFTEIVFNTAHPAHEMLISVLETPENDESALQLRGRIEDASATFKLILAAWARYEAEEKSGERKERLREMRGEWGRMAKAFLKDFEIVTDTSESRQE